MKALVASRPTDDEIQKMTDYLVALVAVFQPHSISLDDKDRRGMRTMGGGREGIVRTMSNIGLSFEECLPRSENAKDMQESLDYHAKLSGLQTLAGKFYEMLSDTTLGKGADILKTYDRFNSHFQTERLHDSNLDLALQPVDDYNKRFGAIGEEVTEPVEPEQPKA